MLTLPAITTIKDRDATLLRVTAFCWLMAKMIGWRMFTTYRLFPTAPVISAINGVPQAVHTFLYILAVLLMFLILLIPKNKLFVLSLLIAEVLSCFLDQNRIQPWDYQYMFILFIIVFINTDERATNTLMGLVMVSIYVYGGLGKLNTGFLHGIWAQTLLTQFFHIHAQSWLLNSGLPLGYAVAIFEITGGIGLVFRKTRKTCALALMMMHVFILIFLGPLGLKYNMVIWPWNVAMIAFLYLLFFYPNERVFQPKALFKGAGIIVVICWGLLPALNFAGLWDNYLSSAIYSGKLPQMVICINDTSQCRPLQRFCVNHPGGACDGQASINLQYWAMSETKMAPYPEIRVYKEIAEKLQRQYPKAGFSFVYYQEGQTVK